MRVQVIKPVNILHKGKKYGLGAIIEDYEGDLNTYVRPVGVSKPQPKPEPKKVKKDDAIMETSYVEPDPIKITPEGTEVLATFSPDVELSPNAIKAKIAEVERAKPKKIKLEDAEQSKDDTKEVQPTKEIEEPSKEEALEKEYNVVEVGRGWYEVQDGTGNVVSEKKMRRDDAEALREELYAYLALN